MANMEPDVRAEDWLPQTGRNVGFLLHQLLSSATSIGILARMLSKGNDLGTESREKARQLVQETDLLEDLLRDALVYVRAEKEQWDPVDLCALLSHVASHARPRASRAGVSLENVIAKDIAPVLGHAYLLREAFMHLVDNAIDAARDTRGTVRLMARADAETAVIEITDSGTGMDREIRERAFDPLFSTKNHGSGLSLAFVRKVIAEHGGTLSLHCVLGKGTCVAVRLPISRVSFKA